MDLLAWHLGQSPAHVSTQTLDLFSDILNMTGLCVTDRNGGVLAAASDYRPKEDDAAASASLAVDALESPIRNGASVITGYVYGHYSAYPLFILQETKSLIGTLQTVQPQEGGFAFAVNAESGQFSGYPDSEMIGKSALDYGMKESDLRNHLCTYIQLDHKLYYAVSGKRGEDLIYVAIPKERLDREVLPLSASAAAAAFVLLLLIALPVLIVPDSAGRRNARSALKERVRGSTAERVVFSVVLMGAVVIGVWFALSPSLGLQGDDGSILAYVLNGNWECGVNVFALTASLILAVEVGLGLLLLRFMARLLSDILSVRAATGIRMLTSLLSYLAVFVVGYRCLVNFGMNPSTLMASAGIVSVVIGIGANSLVGDIIAGIFLLMEGNIREGDVIRIGDFRGRVEEIGIRMTKLYEIETYAVKIIPNKEVQNVVHLSMHLVGLPIDFMIPYEEDLKRVEVLLLAELEAMEGHVPGMEGRPIYMGVENLGDNGVILQIKARCREADSHSVRREITRRVYVMFNRNGIEVPFPQVTVHTPEENRQ